MPKVKDLKKDELTKPEYYMYDQEYSPEYPEGAKSLAYQFPDADKSDLNTNFRVQTRKN